MRRLLREGADRLSRARVPEANIDAEYCLSHATGIPRLALHMTDRAPTAEEAARYDALLMRRETREPLQYILGTQSFMGFDFFVSPAALIPRFDTEILAEQALKRLRGGMTALDLCAGTGAIGLSLKLIKPDVRVTLSDISEDALALAKRSAEALDAAVEIVRGDLFAPFAGRAFDLIVCNPPYIPTGDLPMLQREVTYEPALALDGGGDGLAFYRRLAEQAPAHLNQGGFLCLEIGDYQRARVESLLSERFCDIAVYRDLNDLERVIVARKGEN